MFSVCSSTSGALIRSFSTITMITYLDICDVDIIITISIKFDLDINWFRLSLVVYTSTGGIRLCLIFHDFHYSLSRHLSHIKSYQIHYINKNYVNSILIFTFNMRHWCFFPNKYYSCISVSLGHK